MPIIKQIYLCSLCGHSYDHHHEAVACEALGVPEEAFKVGEEIRYQDESGSSFGGRWSYGGEIHQVAASYIARFSNNEGGNVTHKRVYLVDLGYSVREIWELPEGGYFSPAENKYKPGYIQVIQDGRRRDGIGGFVNTPTFTPPPVLVD